MGDFLAVDFFSPNDKKFETTSEQYGYGGMSIWHPKKFALRENIIVFENYFVEFLEKNYQLLLVNGVKDFDLFSEIYYDGGQCNFEFSKSWIKKLAEFEISLPVSVYALDEKYFNNWSDEIESEWNDAVLK